MRGLIFTACAVFASALVLAPALAQEAPPIPDNAIAVELNNPRQIAYAGDGTLYVAEGGWGGDIEIETPEGPGTFGYSSQLTAVAPDGAKTPLLVNFPSTAGQGIDAVAVSDDAIYALVGGGDPAVQFTASLLRLDAATHRVTDYVDLGTHEATVNPDGNEIDSNPVDVEVADDGTVFITDAGCNCLLTWTPESGLAVFHAWPDNPVPTSVDFGSDGDVYVGFLSPAPYIPGSAKVERWSRDGELKYIYEGLTMVVDLLVTGDDVIYAVELSQDATGEMPAPGAVMRVSEDGNALAADGLVLPYGIAESPDGQVVVTMNSAFMPPNMGAVIPVELE